MRARNIELSRNDIIDKANELSAELTNTPENVGRGWFQGFVPRVGLRRNIFTGESKSVDLSIVSSWEDELPQLMENYDPSDIFNVDETGLFYQQRKSKLPV